jgi:hypothetical protein
MVYGFGWVMYVFIFLFLWMVRNVLNSPDMEHGRSIRAPMHLNTKVGCSYVCGLDFMWMSDWMWIGRCMGAITGCVWMDGWMWMWMWMDVAGG